MEWKVMDTITETDNTKTVRFLPTKNVHFLPGQYFVFHDTVNYLEDCRAYSSSSSPTQKLIDITVKLVKNPHFSKHLHSMPKGYNIEVKGPYGQFYFDGLAKEVVLIGAGSGMAPLRSIMRYTLDKNMPTKIVVVHSAKTSNDLIYREELQKLAKEEKIKLFVTLTKEKGPCSGRINADLLKHAISALRNPAFYICGPQPMITSVKNILAELKINEKEIHAEG